MKEDHEKGVWYIGPDRAEFATQKEALDKLVGNHIVKLILTVPCFKVGPNLIVTKPKFLWEMQFPQGGVYGPSDEVHMDESQMFSTSWWAYCHVHEIEKWKCKIIDTAIKGFNAYREVLLGYLTIADTCVEILRGQPECSENKKKEKRK